MTTQLYRRLMKLKKHNMIGHDPVNNNYVTLAHYELISDVGISSIQTVSITFETKQPYTPSNEICVSITTEDGK